MSFSIRLGKDIVPVDPGKNIPLDISIENIGEEPDTFELYIEGIDPEWFAIPVPTGALEPGQVLDEKLFFKPPRISETGAGVYPVNVVIRSLNTGDIARAQTVIEISNFDHLSIDISPKKGLLTFSDRTTEFVATVINLGNHEQDIQLFATDNDDACTFQTEPDRVTLGAGHEKQVIVRANTLRRPLLANSRLFGMSISARSAKSPSIAASAQAQIEQRAITSPGIALLVLAVCALIFFWILTFPKKPAVTSFAISDESLMIGESAKITWKTANSKSIEILLNQKSWHQAVDVAGSAMFTPKEAGKYEFACTASNGDKLSEPRKLILTVTEPPPVPEPTILDFTVNKSRVNVGDSVLISYTIGDSVTKLVLGPKDDLLDASVKTKTREVLITQEGETELTLTASNSQGKSTVRSVKITAIKGSKAKIIAFGSDVKSASAENPLIKVTWQVSNAVRVELYQNGVKTDVDSIQGALDLTLKELARFKLVAYDSDGITTSREFKVSFTKPANVPPKVEDDTMPPQDPKNPPIKSGGQ